MADTVTNTRSLKIDTLFVDGDTRTITAKNPKPDIQTSEIEELNAYIQANNLLVGDKYDGTFAKITEVRVVEESRVKLDLS